MYIDMRRRLDFKKMLPKQTAKQQIREDTYTPDSVVRIINHRGAVALTSSVGQSY